MKPRSVSKRAAARIRGEETFQGRRCPADGTCLKSTETGQCIECLRYSRGIISGRIQGIDNRAATEKMGALKPVKASWRDEVFWTDEMRQAHSQSIRRGWARRKSARLALEGVRV